MAKILTVKYSTVGELRAALAQLPQDYKVSIAGMLTSAIVIDPELKTVTLDDPKWTSESYYDLSDEELTFLNSLLL